MRWSTERKWVTIGFGLALTLTGLVSVISYQNAIQLRESAIQVKKTHSIFKILTGIATHLTDAESHYWSYISFRNPDDLKQLNNDIQMLQEKLSTLHSRLVSVPDQKQRLAKLETLLIQYIEILKKQVYLSHADRLPLSIKEKFMRMANQNQIQIHNLLNELQIEEERSFQKQIDATQSGFESRIMIEIMGTLLAFGILFGVYAQLYFQMRKRQRLESMQRTLEKEKEIGELKLQFFSMVSHEFRTPFSIILGSAQLLKESLQNQVTVAKLKHLYRIQSSAKLVTQLLNDILTLARADAGKLECQPELIEVQEFCLNLVEDIQTLSESEHMIQFTKKGSSNHAHLDEKLLYAILSNLLSNAIKYSPPTYPIEFTLTCEPELVTFQVKDQGIGISPEDQASLYELFCRGSNVKNTAGSGLGMAVLKKCLDLHQGEITVDSQVGGGTIFTVQISQTNWSRQHQIRHRITAHNHSSEKSTH